MCGIAGFMMAGKSKPLSRKLVNYYFYILEKISKRGPDSIGIQIDSKAPFRDTLKRNNEGMVDVRQLYNYLVDNLAGNSVTLSLAGFRGIPTTEYLLGDFQAIQPYCKDELSIVHNGQFSNDRDIMATEFPNVDLDNSSWVDTKVLLHRYEANQYAKGVYDNLFEGLNGSWAIALYDHSNEYLVLSRSFRGLYIAYYEDKENDERAIFWASEDVFPRPANIDLYIKELEQNSLLLLKKGNINVGELFTNSSYYMAPLRNESNARKCAIVLSGGLDSTVCTADIFNSGNYDEVHLLHFKYGARAEHQEIKSVKSIYKHYKKNFPLIKVYLSFIDMSFLKNLGGSTLTEHDKEVAKGDLGAESTHEWVPARNLAFLGLATSYCDRYDIGSIVLGLNMEEGSVFCLTDHPNHTIRLASGKSKHITDIKVGDKLLSWDENKKKISKSLVTKLHRKNSDEVYRFEVNSGRKWSVRKEMNKVVEATGDHRFYVKHKGWVAVRDIKVDDIIMHLQECSQKERNTYNNPFAGKSRAGQSNPMSGHTRGKKCWCGEKHAAASSEVISLGLKQHHIDNPETKKKISKGVNKYLSARTAEQILDHRIKCSVGSKKAQKRRLKETSYAHHMHNPRVAKKVSRKLQSLVGQGGFNPAISRNREMNGLEKTFANFFAENKLDLKYVGDGQVWLTAKNGRKMNPDFINTKTKTIVEVTSKSAFWHNPQSKRRRIEAYNKLGWSCVFLTDKDLHATNVSNTIDQINGLTNGMTVLKIRKIRKKQIPVYDMTCEPHHNYFVSSSGMLSHNCDNSEEFYNRMEKAIQFGSQSKPRLVMPVGNMMKHHIWKYGRDLNAPLNLSWSCYHGSDKRCGECGPCTMRLRSAMINQDLDTAKYSKYPKFYTDYVKNKKKGNK